MAKRKKNRKQFSEILDLPQRATVAVKPLRPMNEGQAKYLDLITKKDLVFGIGPAGTGKTYVAVAYAADLLKARKVSKIIVTRPAVEAGEKLGFLPGEMGEKFDPYFEPVRDILEERLGKSHVEAMIRTGRIVAKPLAYMRGCTFKDAVVLLDEAQNTTPTQMKLFLTRIGEGTKMIVNGDISQKDISTESGLQDAITRLDGLPTVGVLSLNIDCVIRHKLVRDIIERYSEQGQPLPAFLRR